ncbi:hypothetical protein [Pectobacterium sp. IFB5596]|uniref:hypothetical protein n=1 Tax=Pectobacterium sp. IFB5596 TaxID=1839803 RepID=UPI001F1960C4|nr:hypothetical protein [Pectobacterium sp. IFB5596]MCE9732350.1 hypothetical protein [Pectobacterium sp. IFB5596]
MTDNGIKTFAKALRSPFPVIYLDFRSVDRFLYRIRDLRNLRDHLPDDLIERLDLCHLYMICKRPRLSLIPNSITWNADSISLKVSCAFNGVTHEGGVQLIRPPALRDAKAFSVSRFPHRELLAIDRDGKVTHEMLFANLAHLIKSLPSFAQQLEVLYVGKGLAKNTQDRLANHETLQKILAEINSDDPDSEVFALVYRFDYRRSVGGIVADNFDVKEFLCQNCGLYKPTLDDQVSLIEAATISYFHTAKYNSHYINFPMTDIDAARRAREFGAAYIVVQIDTENIGGVPIYSQRIGPQATHYVVHRIAR